MFSRATGVLAEPVTLAADSAICANSGGRCRSVVTFLRVGLQDKNKFVRAWSYSGFYLLGQQYPEYQDEAKAYIVAAMQDEAPSVQARLRQLGVGDVPGD